MELGTNTVKFILFFFNVCCVICALCLLVLGGIIIWEYRNFDDMEGFWKIICFGIVIIILSLIILGLAILGYCGALRGHVPTLRLYTGILLVLCVCQLVVVVLAFTEYSAISNAFNKLIKYLWIQQETNPKFKVVFNKIESQLKCCGLNNFNEYKDKIPAACCGLEDEQQCTIDKVYKKGCSAAIFEQWERHNILVKSGVSTIAVLLLLASMSARYLVHKVKEAIKITKHRF